MKNNITPTELQKQTRNTDKLLLKLLSADLKQYKVRLTESSNQQNQSAA